MLLKNHSWVRRLWALSKRSGADREIEEELHAHLEMRIADNLASGMDAQTAARNARIRFGNLTATREHVAAIDTALRVQSVWRDVMYAFRSFRINAAFSAVAIITLALGIGANAGIYTVLNAVLLKSLPVNKPEQLRLLKISDDAAEHARFSYLILDRMRAALPASASLSMMSWPSGFNVRFGEAEADRQTGQLVSGDFFSTLQTHPALGRLLAPEDDHPDSGSVAVLSYDYWSKRLGQSAAILNQKLSINGIPVTVVGVAPPGFFGVRVGVVPAFWLPLHMQQLVRYDGHFSSQHASPAQPWAPQPGMRWLQAVLRVTKAEDIPQITAQLNSIYRDDVQLAVKDEPAAEQQQTISRQRIELVPGNKGFERLQKQFSQPLLLLMGMAVTLLLIACANIANLLLARAAARQREIAVRLSIGARRSRVVRQLLTEAVLLSFSGGVLGIGIAWWCARMLPRWASDGASPIPLNLAPDARVLCFSIGLSLLTGILFGLAPALQSTRVELSSVLKASGRGLQGTGGRAKHAWSTGKLLVSAQVALSLTLLVAAGLFLRTIQNYSRLDTGLDRMHLLTAYLDSHVAGFSQDQVKLLYSKIPDAIEALPGVQSASVATCGLSAGCVDASDVWLKPSRGSSQNHVTAQVNTVTPNYFSTVGIPLLQGRIFTAADKEDTPGVAVVNQAFVRRFIRSNVVIGARVTDFDDPAGAHSAEIVGIVGNARVNDVREDAPPLMYFSMYQYPQGLVSVDVRAMGDPHSLEVQVRAVLTRLNIAPQKVLTLQDQIEQNLAQQRAVSRLTTWFGLLALSLACLGLYGIVAYDVARRTGEIGVRLALGSTQAGVRWLILKESMAVIAVGIVTGIALSLAVARVARSLLFGLTAQDPTTLVAAATLLLMVALCAAAIPAWRASRVNPTEALRME
jgi:predicted permease